MKKIIALLLVLCTLAALTACGTENKTEPVTTLTNEASTELTEGTDAPTQAVAGTVEAKRISKLICLNEYDSDFSEYCFGYDDEDLLSLTFIEDDTPLWERHFFPGGEQVRREIFFDMDGTIYSSQEYDEAGNMIEEAFSIIPGGELYTRVFEYDAQGLPLSTTVTCETEDTFLLETMVYNDQGQIIEYINYNSLWEATHSIDASDPEETIEGETIRETWVYDDAGRVTEYYEYTNDVEATHETWVYDEQGNILENRSSYIYDDESYEAYSITINTYDEAGNLIVSVCEGSDPANDWKYQSVYTYDEAGNLIEQVDTHDDGDIITDTWTYDEAGNLITSITHYNMDGWYTYTTENTYNADGLLIEELHRDECEHDEDYLSSYRIIYTYDEAGRLIEEIYEEQDTDIYRTVYHYDSNGNLVQVLEYYDEDEIIVFQWSYDDNGELLDVSNDAVESLAALGEQLLVVDPGSSYVCYAAVTYEIVSVTEEEAQVIENINEYILSSL